jgi:hypothetical protein
VGSCTSAACNWVLNTIRESRGSCMIVRFDLKDKIRVKVMIMFKSY